MPCLLAVVCASLLLVPLAHATGTPGPAGVGHAAAFHARPPRRGRARSGLRGHRHSGRAHVAIVGGAPISIGQAPWQAAVEATIPEGGGSLLCGGAILDVAHVVTAAHCVFDPETGEEIPPQDFVVRAGTTNLVSPPETEQDSDVTAVRPHPFYSYAPDSGEVGSDDIAVLTLEEPLIPGPAVAPISAVALGAYPPEGAEVELSGFGEEQPLGGTLDGELHSLSMRLGYSRECGGENDAVLLCGSASLGSPCNGDSGSALTLGPTDLLVGVEDAYLLVSGQKCSAGAENAFANVAAPEIQDFLDGSETPPRAPRGGGAVIREAPVGDGVMSCEPGTWSESPTFTYSFFDGTDGQNLQQGSSPTYAVPPAEVGRSILCEVQASNEGGTGLGRTPALHAIDAAPVPPPQSPPAAASEVPAPPPAAEETSGLSLIGGGSISVEGGDVALVTLKCLGAAGCHGKLTLTATGSVKPERKVKSAKRIVTIGTARLSIPSGATKTIEIRLDPAGRALLRGRHGRLAARLAILQQDSGQAQPKTESVELVRAR
jgi:Trypsin